MKTINCVILRVTFILARKSSHFLSICAPDMSNLIEKSVSIESYKIDNDGKIIPFVDLHARIGSEKIAGEK